MPKTGQKSRFLTPTSRLLNVGCGRRYDRRWVNLDLDSRDASVVQCFRVLAPGGVLRIVVPDLEKIAQLYLQKHEQAWAGDEIAAVDYNWMKMELLDQLVREKSGGRMGPYMASVAIRNSDFVSQRVGDEFSICRASMEIEKVREPSLMTRLHDFTRSSRERWARRFVRWLLGREKAEALQEGLFRSQGEIHRWMYDRYSLRQLCQQYGFEQFDVCSAFESSIDDYVKYQLDAEEQTVRKPDSLFVECVKPNSFAHLKTPDSCGSVNQELGVANVA